MNLKGHFVRKIYCTWRLLSLFYCFRRQEPWSIGYGRGIMNLCWGNNCCDHSCHCQSSQMLGIFGAVSKTLHFNLKLLWPFFWATFGNNLGYFSNNLCRYWPLPALIQATSSSSVSYKIKSHLKRGFQIWKNDQQIELIMKG